LEQSAANRYQQQFQLDEQSQAKECYLQLLKQNQAAVPGRTL